MDLALFDFDGTITDREMFIAFLELAIPARRRAFAKALLFPLFVGYKLGVVPGDVIRAASVRVGFSRVPLKVLEVRGQTFAEQILPGALRPEALERIRWHQARGDTIAVVSGALELALSAWCAQQSLDLLGSVLEHREGILTGRYLGQQCLRNEKARRIRERYDLTRYDTIYAYGDTKDDLDMLALADRRHYRWKELSV